MTEVKLTLESFTKFDWILIMLFISLVTFVSTATLLLSLEDRYVNQRYFVEQENFVFTSRLAACANAITLGSLEDYPVQKKLCLDVLHTTEQRMQTLDKEAK